MPMSVVYTTINGQIVHENRNGVEAFYVPDTNGNTVALLDVSGNVTDTFTYWPFGEIQSHVGTSTTPFTFGGVLGCYSDSWGGIYMRAREYVPQLTRWLTVDPLWPQLPPYSYAYNNPVTFADPGGNRPGRGPTDPCAPGGTNRNHPPNCSKCGPGCKPTYMTCFSDPSPTGGVAVYCTDDSTCKSCRDRGYSPGKPSFPVGSKVCIYGQNGPVTKKVNDCGCGLYPKDHSSPDNWMDFWAADCHTFKDGWRCVCPGACK